VKPSNVLLDGSCRPQIGDVGLASVSVEGESTMARRIGSPRYTAPELHDREEHVADGPVINVFAWGMILYELIRGVPPFGLDNPQDVIEWVADGQRPGIPDDTPPRQREILENCWRHNPDERWMFADVLSRSDALMLEGCNEDEFAQYRTLVCAALSE
jgi:serine/threonine protein kinase